jgi:hypothetical protein
MSLSSKQTHIDTLWPFSKALAIVLAPVIWIIFAILVALLRQYTSWLGPELRTPLLYAGLALGLIPLVLVLLDFAASRRAVLDIKGVKIDFSQANLDPAEASARSFRLPDNIGISGAIVSDTSAMQIIGVLKQATANEVVIVDLKDGHAWWVTRLLALCAGAMQAGSPKVLAFLGLKHNLDGAYLGWAEPAAVLNALLADRPEYRDTYDRAVRITRQLALFADPDITPFGITPHANVARYSGRRDYAELGDAALEQILMDLLASPLPGISPANRSLEDPPDRLTLHRFDDLFEPYLHTDAMDLNAPSEAQVKAFLDSQAAYVALVRSGKYESMLRRDVGERLILRELVTQSRPA